MGATRCQPSLRHFLSNQGVHVRSRTFAAIGASAAIALGLAACGSDDNTDSTTQSAAGTETTASVKFSGAINAGGSTFAKPVYDTWGSKLKAQGLTFNFAGTGSGAGVAGVTDGTLDFGGSDSAMDDEELAAAKKGKAGEVVHVPTFFGAVVAAYNVKGIDTGLKLDGETLADIFLGDVTTWNDKKIADQNPGVQLPDAKISVVHRSDESGTTKAFLSYLGAYSKKWEDGPGVDKSVKWPTGAGAKGNDGVAAAVKQTENSIGYVEQAYALQNDFTYASLKNKDGNYVEPTLESVSAAGDSAEVPEDLRFSIANAPGAQTYPDASATFVIVPKDLCKAGKSETVAKDVKGFLTYGLTTGQEEAKQLAYAPLPASVLDKAKAAVDSLQCNGAPISETR
ncbi:phosphate ABC transporter substrate-binding protein PstS [Patulibacter sp. SYSU D01012]|uniref:phosphate ABC transporter substrate-binding protein PstS n=1 Tax=Patulibacter sp. SYSU D01012 TaxID=2817381 RepID=UPI001B31062B|nr:phosphate ABC transporter substrate-binding protein PstS [Patulibacter sp. SYSU D01012]